MPYDEFFPKDFLNAEDLLKESKVLTIRRMGREEVGPDKKPKLVARFDETDKGMVINQTNADTLKQLFGPEPQDAIGGRIELYAGQAMFNGKSVPALRLRRPSRTHGLPIRGEPPRRPSSAIGEPPNNGAPPHDAVPDGPAEDDLPY
jgi:hypothetical protein